MIVSGESKMGQMQSRVRSRRRVERSDPRPSAVEVQNPVSSTIRGMTSTPIVVDDEDDDVVVSSPRSYAQAIFMARVESVRSRRQARVAVEEDPLELRLGPGGTSEYSTQSSVNQQPRQGRRGRPARPTIDLTTPLRAASVNEDCVLLNDNPKSRKRKGASLEPSFIKELSPVRPVPQTEEYKLKCAICMDTMKEETSTICGHIFCRTCIHGAIHSQKKCPTCRKKLTLKNIHRIYL